VVSEAIAAVKPGRILIGTQKRFVGTGVDRDICAAEFYRVEGVSSRLLNGNVSGDGGDRDDAYVSAARRLA
jgi:hypothetical protein